MEENTPVTEESAGLASAPIIPSLPEIQSGNNPMAALNAPSPVVMPPIITPVIPSGQPTSYNINQQIQGDYNSGPVPGAKPSNIVKNKGTLDFVKAAVDYMHDDNTVKDRYKYGRTYSYGSGHKNMNFERYYKHPKFEELGFSPYRDNEAIYNENSSWWDDFNRMRGEWGGLVWTGFKSVWGDEEAANESMEKAMAIGSSSRGGLGGWVSNFGINSAYTVGILGEVLAEDLALGAAEALSGGAATPLVGAELVKQGYTFKRLAEAWNGTYKFMQTLRSAEKAKEVFKAAKAGEKIKDALNWAAPFKEFREWTTHLAQGTGGVENMGKLAKTTRTFGNFYRGVRELNLAHSEARLEGEGAASEYQEQLIDKFYADNGRMPEGKEAEQIYERAQSVKGAVTMANDYTIYLTNKLVFENIFKPFNPAKAVENAFFKGSNRTLKRTAAAEFKVGTKSAYAAAEHNTKNKIFNALFKSEYVPWSRRYFLGNLSEALQENSQEVIRIAALDYHDKIHSDPSQLGFYGTLNSIGKGVGGQFSQQGLDTFLQGYLMGSLIQGGGGFLKNAGHKGIQGVSGLMHTATKGKFGTEFGATGKAEQEAQTRQEEVENERLNSVNFILDNALIYGGERSDTAAAIKNIYAEKNKAESNGDEYNARNLNNEAQVNHFHTLARSESMSLIDEHVDDMLTLDDKSLEDAYNNVESASNIRQKLSTLKERAQGYQRKYDTYRKERPNNYNPWMYDKEKNPEEYERELNNYLAHEQIMADVLFNTETHEDISRRLAALGNDLMGQGSLGKMFNTRANGQLIENALGSDISILADSQLRKSEMLNIAARIAVLKQGTIEQKKEAGMLEKQLEMLTEWNGMADTLMREINSETRASVSEEEQAARRQRANLYPGTIVKDNETGEEYTVHRHVVGTGEVRAGRAGTILKDKNGNSVRFDPNKHSKVKDAPDLPSRFREVEGDRVSWTIQELYKVYEKYIKQVAKMKNGYVFDEQMQEAFVKIKDFIRLSIDDRKVVNTINLLSDPVMYDRYFNWQAEIQALARKGKAMAIERAFNKFKQMADKNKMLSELFDLGIFVLPESIKKLKQFEVPDLYDITSKTILSPDSLKYEKAIEVIERYAAKQGKKIVRPEPVVTQEEITEPEVKEEKEVSPSDLAVTDKTSIDDLKTYHKALLRDLLPAYRTWYEETYANATSATDDEILKSDDFLDFMQMTVAGKTIVNNYNQGKAEPQKEVVPKKETIKEPTSKLDPISDLIYEEFKSNNRVSPAVLERIAARIVDGTPLSAREEEIRAAKEEEINNYKEKIEKEKASTPVIVTENMRRELIQDLRYTKEQVSKMTPEEANRIIKEGITNPELAKKEGGEDDLVAKLAKVETAQDLENWKTEAVEFRAASESERRAFEERHGIKFNGDYVREQVEMKVQELRDKLEFDSLKPGELVVMVGGKIMAVKTNDGNMISLVEPMAYANNDPDAKTVEVPKDELKNYIMMKNGEFADTAESAETLTPEEMDEAKKEIDSANSLMDNKKMDQRIDEAMIADPKDIVQNAINKFKSCKIG